MIVRGYLSGVWYSAASLKVCVFLTSDVIPKQAFDTTSLGSILPLLIRTFLHTASWINISIATSGSP